jgi:hypothetical protein
MTRFVGAIVITGSLIHSGYHLYRGWRRLKNSTNSSGAKTA